MPVDSKLFAQMTHSAPGWNLRMAITRVLQTESLGHGWFLSCSLDVTVKYIWKVLGSQN